MLEHFHFDFRGQNVKPIQRFPSYKPKCAIIFLIRVKGPVVKSRHRQKLSRYNGDVQRRRSWHFRFLLRGGPPIASYCFYIQVYIPDLVVALKTWYLF